MKRKVSLLIIVLGALALALAGFLQDVSTSKALIPLPVRPMRPATPKLTMYSTTALGQPLDSKSYSAGAHGMRGSLAYANWTRGGTGYADIMVNDNQMLGDFMTSSDFLCDATDDTVGDLVADFDPLNPTIPQVVPFDEVTTDVVAAGESYLLSKAGVFPMTARFGSSITNVWLFGTVPLGVTPIPVSILTLRVPWSMQTGISQIWIGGLAAKPANPPMCTDGSENTLKLPNGNMSETLGSGTVPVTMTNTPPIRGDSSGPCVGPNCADKRIFGWWASPTIVDATGGPQVITVTQRALNGGPFPGNFKDVWHVEAPAGVTATWGATITERHWDPLTSSWVSDLAPTVVPSIQEISFVEDVPIPGNTYEDVGTLNVSCGGGSDYVVSIKAAAYPIGLTADNDLSSNVSVTSIRVKCTAAAPEVDKQALSLAGTIIALTPSSVPLNPPITPLTPPSDHVQLLVGDKATLGMTALSRAQAAGNVPTTEWLVAEAPDMNGDGAYDIGLNWVPQSVNDGCPAIGPAESGAQCANATDDDGDTVVNDGCPQIGPTAESGAQCTNAIDDDDVTGVSGSEPANQIPLPSGPTAVCIPWGPTPCAGLNVSMTEPGGPMVMVNASLEITCAAPGTYLVPLKLVELPTTFGDSAPANNSAWQAVTVYCWGSPMDVEDDGIDDSSGLYGAFTSYVGEADARRSVTPASKPATALASDTGYVERYIEWDCVYNDLNGAPDTLDPNSIGWITPAESRLDPNIPVGIDDNGDCMADAALAQPGKPADFNDVPGVAMCAPILYNEGNAPYAQTQYLQSADEDCDGLVDGVEVVFGSNPRLADSDGDGASDFFEAFQFSNPLNPDTDGDGILDGPEDDYIAAAIPALQCSNNWDDDGDGKVNDGCPAVVPAESGTACDDNVDSDSDTVVNDGCPAVTTAEGAVTSGEKSEAANVDDNCPIVYNPTQANNDGMRRANGGVVPGDFASNPNQDKLGDACDDDDDNDAALDVAEALTPVTDAMNSDTDGDGCVDGWESMQGTDPTLPGAKCPASLRPGDQKYAKGCHLNLPGADGGPFVNGYSGSPWIEMDADGDGVLCQTGAAITDTDSDDGSGAASPPVQIVDAVEAMGYNTALSRKDTDGDGCEDWIEIVDINGNRSAELLDVLFVAKRALGVDPSPGSDRLLDIDKNGSVTILDALVAAKNSSLVKSHSPCASEG